jgi:nucleoside-diphosphate-sugar epimerase
MRIAVTGGNGDMGRTLIPHLTANGHAVVSIDRVLPTPGSVFADPTVTHVVADVNDFGQLVAAASGCDALVHLAAHRSPMHTPDHIVYVENTAGSYHALAAAAALGIKRVCLASSINAIGAVFSRTPRFDYFPVDERHPSYTEDPYSLSKWVLEQQADAFARRHPWLTIASLRFHWLLDSRERAMELTARSYTTATRHLWAYTLLSSAARACLLSLTADCNGHEAFFIVAPRSALEKPSLEAAREHYPATPIRGDLSGDAGFFDCSKAERLLGWKHDS